MARRRGQLETEVMGVLWARPEGLTARQVVDALPGDAPAITTVLTVLDRLRGKGLVARSAARRADDGSGGYVFSASQSQSDHVVAGMLGSLTASGDRHAALMHFAGRLDPDDAEVLRQALGHRAGTGSRG